jgi:hypothetical protein
MLLALSVAGLLGKRWALGSRIIYATKSGRSVSKPLFPVPECGEPSIEIELVHGARCPKPSVLYGSVLPDTHPRRLLPQEGGLIRWDRLTIDHVLSSELRVVVQVAGEVKSLVSLPIAISQEPLKDPDTLGRLGRIGPKPLDERILT